MSEFEELFTDGKTVEIVRIGRLADWFKNEGRGRLRLPPIQRSFVWTNEKILNYWDSLIRGYPSGMMMVMRVRCTMPQYGRDKNGKTVEVGQTDFHLFDGQQRLTALLLGLGEGSLNLSHRIWVDIGRPKGSGDRLYELRINSSGQPFGYRADAPNEKMRVWERRAAHQSWPSEDGKPQPPDKIFMKMAEEPVGQLGPDTCVSLRVYPGSY